MASRNLDRVPSFGGSGGLPDLALEKVMNYIDDPRDRDAISFVCRQWRRMDSDTRKHITIALCYSTTPDLLRRRFPNLTSLKLKGKPRASMFFNLIPEDWGGYAAPWVTALANGFDCLDSLHLRRMIVQDDDIDVLVRSRGPKLKVLKLDKCSGFSTNGLLMIARFCRDLRNLFLEECIISGNSGEWLHELAVTNKVLESLNFYMTELRVLPADLELLARNCRSLTSLKISDCDLSDLIGFFQSARALEEFAGGSFNEQQGEMNRYGSVRFPPKLCRLGLSFMGTNEMHIILPLAASLKKLDLLYTFLSTEDHCQLIQQCPNLEILEARDVIGDRGLEVVARTCKRLRRLRVERGEDDQGLEDEQGIVSQRGLSAIAEGCPELEFLAVYVSDITNSALEIIGAHCKNLYDFRLVLLDRADRITDLPIDNGVRSLLMGCSKLRRFALYLRHGGLSDVGLRYIGENSPHIRWMLLGLVGESDEGLLQFANGCPAMQKLELRGCCFSERAIALAVMQLRSLRYIWVQGYNATPTGRDLLLMARPFWNIEFFPPRREMVPDENYDQPCEVPVDHPAQLLAYYSFAGRRMDYPNTVVPLYP